MNAQPHTLEPLEDRKLFSVVTPADDVTPVLIAAPVAVAATHSPFTAIFNVAGTYSHVLGNPDAGAQYKFNGSGKTAALGSFTLNGTITGPGFIANGRAHGRFVITTSKGTIVVSARGPTQSSSSLPSSMSFTIISGTGAYTKSAGTGKLVVSASGTTSKFLFQFRPSK